VQANAQAKSPGLQAISLLPMMATLTIVFPIGHQRLCDCFYLICSARHTLARRNVVDYAYIKFTPQSTINPICVPFSASALPP